MSYLLYYNSFMTFFITMKKILTIVCIVSTSLLLTWCGKQVDPNEWWKLDSFAQCLTDAWLKMYGTERCPHCQNQKKLFWSSFAKINFIDCDAQKVQCDVAKIEWYPTWVFNGKQYQWEQPLEELASITSCELPQTPQQ